MTIGERIRQLREQQNMTQEELAKKLGYTSKTSIAKIEAGVNDLPQRKIVMFAEALNSSIAYLMGWDAASASNIIPLQKARFVPVVGSIACGTPILAEQNIDSYLPVPKEITCDFCLRCDGDSMIDAGIRDGDIVYIREAPDVDDGKIAAVLLHDSSEATLKRVYHGEGQITLMPANTSYSPIVISGTDLAGVRILGLAVAVTSRI